MGTCTLRRKNDSQPILIELRQIRKNILRISVVDTPVASPLFSTSSLASRANQILLAGMYNAANQAIFSDLQ